MNEIILHGCTPEPLMNYLKALGVFRIVSEQADPGCRAAWRGGVFVLRTKLDQDALSDFLIEDYMPSPVVVPWSDKHFFEVKPPGRQQKHKNTPTGATLIEAFLTNDSPRIKNYREAIQACLAALAMVGINKKEQMKDAKKAAYLAKLRTFAVPHLDEWIDAAAALPGDELRLNTLLGSGGGSDGRAHFSDNFMQNLWEMLPAFSEQKSGKPDQAAVRSRELLRNALFDFATDQLEPGRTSSLYNSGAVGGPNAGQGFERKAFANPWCFILTIEGTIVFSGSVTRRLTSNTFQGVFPFQTRTSGSDGDSLSPGEGGGREIWLPLWNRLCQYTELRSLLSEGRSDWRGKAAERGVDFAKAVASLGIDRGVECFARYAIVKGRVGGDNYCTAAHLGRFEVRVREDVHLLREADEWINRYRRVCSDKSPVRFLNALRRIDSSVFDYCQFGGTERFQSILIALGRAERELSVTAGKVGKDGNCPPLHGLSAAWVRAADDQSAEFQIAAALASIQGIRGKYPGFRGNLEPLDPEERLPKWLADTPIAVWNRGNLAANLLAVLERRLIDAGRLSLEHPPLAATYHAHPNAIAAFLAGQLDESRIEDLLWGLVCCKAPSNSRIISIDQNEPLSRAYILLKAVFSSLQRNMPIPGGFESPQKQVWDALCEIHPDPRILHLLRAGSTEEALKLASRRCMHAGLAPADIDWAGSIPPSGTSHRLASALLIPTSPRDLVLLWQQIARQPG